GAEFESPSTESSKAGAFQRKRLDIEATESQRPKQGSILSSMAAIARKPDAAAPSAEAPEDDILPPSRSVGYLVRQTHRALTRALQARIAPHGVSIGMWFFLRALWQEDGISQRELSQRVGMMEPTTASALNNMERKGFVRRVRNRTDRRIVNVFLTERG